MWMPPTITVRREVGFPSASETEWNFVRRLIEGDLIPEDECPTPWDVCCDDPDVITASIATIQVVDDEGRPLKSGLRGVGGMKELSSLVVKGVVAKGSNEKNFLVNATGIHVAMAEPTKENPAKKN